MEPVGKAAARLLRRLRRTANANRKEAPERLEGSGQIQVQLSGGTAIGAAVVNAQLDPGSEGESVNATDRAGAPLAMRLNSASRMALSTGEVSPRLSGTPLRLAAVNDNGAHSESSHRPNLLRIGRSQSGV